MRFLFLLTYLLSSYLVPFFPIHPPPPLPGYIYVGHTWGHATIPPRFRKREPCFALYLMCVLGSRSSMVCTCMFGVYIHVITLSSAVDLALMLRCMFYRGWFVTPHAFGRFEEKTSQNQDRYSPGNKPVLLFFGNRK